MSISDAFGGDEFDDDSSSVIADLYSNNNIIERVTEANINRQYTELGESIDSGNKQYSEKYIEQMLIETATFKEAVNNQYGKDKHMRTGTHSSKVPIPSITQKTVDIEYLHKMIKSLEVRINAMARDNAILRKKLALSEHGSTALQRNVNKVSHEHDQISKRMRVLDNRYHALEEEVAKSKNKGGRPRKIP